jgi:hypothetical protein
VASKGGAEAPLFVVSMRVVLRRGRKRNLPLLSVVFFGFFLLDKQKKETPSLLSPIGLHFLNSPNRNTLRRVPEGA